jgi:GNAT superfamily N-acetyltransferase
MALSKFSFPLPMPGQGASFSSDLQPGGGDTASPWLRFAWNTSVLVNAPEGADLIRRATREEGEEVLRVLLLSLSMDSAWNDSFAQAEHYLTEAVARLFNTTDPLCLVIPKGNRMIAASLIDPSSETAFHLVSGPCVLMEYRNRGIGSRLLHASLAALAEAGVTNPNGITRDKTVASKYVFPKFGGSSERVVLEKSA